MKTLEELGLWYDEDTQCIIDTSSVATSSDVRITARTYRQNEDGIWLLYVAFNIPDSGRKEDLALINYLEDTPPPTKLGEVWEIVLEDGEKTRAFAYPMSDGSVEFFTVKGIFFSENTPNRRLLITAEGEYVG